MLKTEKKITSNLSEGKCMFTQKLVLYLGGKYRIVDGWQFCKAFFIVSELTEVADIAATDIIIRLGGTELKMS